MKHKKIITVDFDDTLVDSQTGKPIVRVCNFVLQKAKEGFELHIITFRNADDLADVLNFIEIYKFPIETVIPTSRSSKWPHMLGLNSTLHIDDDVETLVLAKQKGIEGLLVKNEYNSRNSSSKFFDTI